MAHNSGSDIASTGGDPWMDEFWYTTKEMMGNFFSIVQKLQQPTPAYRLPHLGLKSAPTTTTESVPHL
jgi:hypothetical protein